MHLLMPRRLGLPLILCIMVLPLPHGLLFGQTGAGNIQGTVKDTSSAVIPGATITALHTATGTERRTTSNDVGFFLIPGLQPGAHRISVEAKGMQRWVAGVSLQVGQTLELQPGLSVASTTITETVVGDVTPLVTTSSPTLGHVVDRERVEQLPLNGRFVQNLIFTTTPGLEMDPTQPKVYGLRNAMEFMQDGALLANRDQGGITTRPPGLDTVQEFRVETSNSSAKLSRAATTILSTKSGTNSVHGALFETARNNGIGVARRRQETFSKAPQLIRNEFGASAGAPVFLPKVYDGRNKTFFFFASLLSKINQ